MSSAGPYDAQIRQSVVTVAASLIGAREWDANVMKYTNNNQEPWCSDFLSWVFGYAGFRFDNKCTVYGISWRPSWQISGVSKLEQYLKDMGAYHPKRDGYVPQGADIVIFLSAGASRAGIIERTDTPSSKTGGTIYTIEGNTSNMVARRSYSMKDSKITGYGDYIGKKYAPQTPAPAPPATK